MGRRPNSVQTKIFLKYNNSVWVPTCKERFLTESPHYWTFKGASPESDANCVGQKKFKTKIAQLANRSSSQVLVFLSFPPPPINLCYRNCDGGINKPERYLSKRLGHKLILRSIKTGTNFTRRQRADFLSQINLPSASWYVTLCSDVMSKIYVPQTVLRLIKFVQLHGEETLPSPLRREASDGRLRLVLSPP